jgi:Nucleotidyltransferase of unknown function (DUF6036)
MSTNDDAPKATLDRQTILRGLQILAERLGQRGTTGELCLFGGAVMVLAYSARVSTKDVDALFQPAQAVRDLVEDIAAEMNLPADWLNDGVKGFISSRHETTAGNLPQFPHLRLTMPVPEYLLAMKCMAARVGGTTDAPSDVADIVFLIRHLKCHSAEEVLNIVSRYYPANVTSVKTRYLVEGLFDEGVV